MRSPPMNPDRLGEYLAISPAAVVFVALTVYVFLLLSEDLRRAPAPKGLLPRAWRGLLFGLYLVAAPLAAFGPALVVAALTFVTCCAIPLTCVACAVIARWAFRGMMNAAPHLPAGVEAALPLKGRWIRGVICAIAAMATAAGVLALAVTLLVALAMLGMWLLPW